MSGYIDAAAQNAVIANSFVELKMNWNAGLRLIELRNLATGTNWIPQPPNYTWGSSVFHPALVSTDYRDLWPDLAPPSREFLLRVAPEPESGNLSSITQEAQEGIDLEISGSTPCVFAPGKSGVTETTDASRLDLTMIIAEPALEVTVHTEIPGALPVVRRWVSVRNVGEKPLRLSRFLGLMLSLRPSPADLDLYWMECFIHPCISKGASRWRQMTMHQERLGPVIRRTLKSGPYPRLQDGSHGCASWAALRDPDLQEGLFLGWEWSGFFDCGVGDFEEGAGVFGVRAGLSDDDGYSRLLQPGEVFATPKAFFGCFQGSVEEAGRATRQVAERLFALPWPESRAPQFVGYDTWNNWQDFKSNTGHLLPERLDRELDLAAELGCELFILDYDWFPRLGDYWSDPKRFPNGVEDVAARAKARGMKFGLWMGFGQVHQDSQVAREHPEWLVTKNGRAITGGWGMYSLCLGYAPCRDWVLDQICQVVERFGVDWLKHDFDLLPASDAQHHAPGASDSRVETVLGYYRIMDELRRRFPRLYLDNWTPAQGGADYGNFQRHHSMMALDWYTPVAVRSALQGLAHLFPYPRLHTYIRGFDRAAEKSAYTYRSACFGNGMYLLNDSLQWDAETIGIVRHEIDLIKETRDLFLEGETYALIPKQADHWGWEARFVYASRQGKGMAQVFRNHDARSEHIVRFRGLEQQAQYRVEWVDTAKKGVFSAETLTQTGIEVVLQRPFSVATLIVTKEC